MQVGPWRFFTGVNKPDGKNRLQSSLRVSTPSALDGKRQGCVRGRILLHTLPALSEDSGVTITDHPIRGFNLHSADASPGAAPRTSGIHLSGILRKMALEAGKLPAEYANSNAGTLIRETPVETAGDSSTLCRMAFGMAWEQWIANQIEAHVVRSWP